MAPVIQVRSEHPQGAYAARILRELAEQFLVALRLGGAEVSVLVTTDLAIRRINRTWREIDKPTDVLSFPAGDAPRVRGQPRTLGDVVISLDTARRRARDDGRPMRAELARYLAHGLLHLLGHDHHEPGEAGRMARAEAKLLGAAGLVADAAGDCVGTTETKPASSPGPRAGSKSGKKPVAKPSPKQSAKQSSKASKTPAPKSGTRRRH